MSQSVRFTKYRLLLLSRLQAVTVWMWNLGWKICKLAVLAASCVLGQLGLGTLLEDYQLVLHLPDTSCSLFVTSTRELVVEWLTKD